MPLFYKTLSGKAKGVNLDQINLIKVLIVCNFHF